MDRQNERTAYQSGIVGVATHPTLSEEGDVRSSPIVPSHAPTAHQDDPAGAVPQTSVVRLALLVTGLLAATSTVLAQVAAALDALQLTPAAQPESIARRLRRTLSDSHLQASTCYIPVLAQILDWPAVLQGTRRIVLAVDESSKADQIHLFRVSLPYWGGSLPLAWAVWEQHVALPDGAYWRAVDQVLDEVAALLPRDL